VITLPVDTPVDITLPDNPLLGLTLTVGAVDNVVESADGTQASATASLLHVQVVLAPGELDLTLADLSIAPMAVSASAPAGGIDCGNPLREVHKDVSAATVQPGGQFEYTLVVPNRDDRCTLADVTVTDHVTGPAGSTIKATDPTGNVTSSDGGAVNDITWTVDAIAPNETLTFKVLVGVPTTATAGQDYSDVLTVSATCGATPYTETDTIEHIPKVVAPNGSGCSVDDSNKAASHEQVFAGETFDYFVHVFNSGSTTCHGVTTTDTLDQRVTFVSCSDACTHNGQTVSWNIGDLGAGSSVTLRITVQVNDGATGTLANDATIRTPDERGSTDVHVTGPRITGVSVLAAINPAAGENAPVSAAPLARTGPKAPVDLALVGGLAGLALALQRLRRRATT
jgi:uncharacterized repeat protein (TIGR01451 family)